SADCTHFNIDVLLYTKKSGTAAFVKSGDYGVKGSWMTDTTQSSQITDPVTHTPIHLAGSCRDTPTGQNTQPVGLPTFTFQPPKAGTDVYRLAVAVHLRTSTQEAQVALVKWVPHPG